jgi:hypothetical protein
MKRLIWKGSLALGLLAASFLTPAATQAKPICMIGCVDTAPCTRNSQCPGSYCNFVCPNNGCCAA